MKSLLISLFIVVCAFSISVQLKMLPTTADPLNLNMGLHQPITGSVFCVKILYTLFQQPIELLCVIPHY